MLHVVERLSIIGQGLIGSSITRAVYERNVAREVIVTDASADVRKSVIELGLGQAKVVNTNSEAVQSADLVIVCVPVGQLGAVAKEIGPHLKRNAIVSDVGSVKGIALSDMQPHLPKHVHLVPAHPLAGTEQSGPESGLPRLFVNRWCIITPAKDCKGDAIATVKSFWQRLGAEVEVMSATRHDYVVAITSHLPHLIAFTIFHTALRHENKTDSEVIKFSAGGFRDFTRIASSNPTMWRDIFLSNKEAVLDVLNQFNADLSSAARAIEQGDADKLLEYFSTSRKVRRRVLDKEHISVVREKEDASKEAAQFLISPYFAPRPDQE